MQVYDLSAVQFRGASAGALISCLAACQARRSLPSSHLLKDSAMRVL